jgi:hypothetical protein
MPAGRKAAALVLAGCLSAAGLFVFVFLLPAPSFGE